MNSLFNGLALALQGVGVRMIDRLWRLGSGMRLFMLIIVSSGESFRRLHLTIREIYFTGVLSMQIILVSGFFVGMVLALQMFYVLRQFGSPDYTGVVLALSIIRELGPVVTALLFAGRAGTAITAEIGLKKANEEQERFNRQMEEQREKQQQEQAELSDIFGDEAKLNVGTSFIEAVINRQTELPKGTTTVKQFRVFLLIVPFWN